MGLFWNSKKDEEKIEKEKEEKEKNIEVAIRFLKNPKVTSIPESQKKAFLKKKGLSIKDIEEAYKRVAEEKKTVGLTNQEEGEQTKMEGGVVNQIENKIENRMENLIEKSKETKLLSIRQMKVTCISQEILGLSQLQVLILSLNEGIVIPEEIKEMKELKIVQAVGCQMSDKSISEELFRLPCLQELNLSRNQLSNIDGIIECKSLVRGDFSFNQIIALPEKIEECVCLQLLNITHNNISLLPPSITQINTLKSLFLQGNNLDQQLVQSAKTEGIKGVKHYLNALH